MFHYVSTSRLLQPMLSTMGVVTCSRTDRIYLKDVVGHFSQGVVLDPWIDQVHSTVYDSR